MCAWAMLLYLKKETNEKNIKEVFFIYWITGSAKFVNSNKNNNNKHTH